MSTGLNSQGSNCIVCGKRGFFYFIGCPTREHVHATIAAFCNNHAAYLILDPDVKIDKFENTDTSLLWLDLYKESGKLWEAQILHEFFS